jgi:hypothetical protein
VDQVSVHEQQHLAVFTLENAMAIPNLFEQGAWRGGGRVAHAGNPAEVRAVSRDAAPHIE